HATQPIRAGGVALGITIGAYIDGGGHVGPHMKDVAASEHIDTLLVTGSEEARGIAVEMEKAQFVDDWQALLDDPAVPAVMVLTKNRDAGRLTREAVEAGTWGRSAPGGQSDGITRSSWTR
ncbi:MAG: hypothetical protein ACOCUZ_00135, partial [bacterium]